MRWVYRKYGKDLERMKFLRLRAGPGHALFESMAVPLKAAQGQFCYAEA